MLRLEYLTKSIRYSRLIATLFDAVLKVQYLGRLVDILLGKGDKEFNTFCDLLAQSNHLARADRCQSIIAT